MPDRRNMIWSVARARRAAGAIALVVAASLFAAPPVQDPAEVSRAVDALLRSESGAADKAWALPPEQLDLVARRLVEHWKRYPYGQLGLGEAGARSADGLAAMQGLMKGRPPLPNGAPEVLVEELQHALVTPKPGVDAGALAGVRYTFVRESLMEATLAADGLGRAVGRFDDMHPMAAAIYGAEIASKAWPPVWAQENQPSTHWSEEDRLAALQAMAQFGVALIEDCGAEGILFKEFGWELTPSMLLWIQVQEGKLTEEARVIAADGYLAVADAQMRVGVGDPSAAAIVAIQGLLGMPGPANLQIMLDLSRFERPLTALAGFHDASLDPTRLGRMVRLVDGACRYLAPLDAAVRRSRSVVLQPDGSPYPDGPTGVDKICDALSLLVLRIHAIPPSHAAWTEENRCLWLEAVDRDRSGERDAKCDSIAKAWTTAREGISAEWREQCKTKSERDAAGRDAKRAERKARREAWELKMKEAKTPSAPTAK